MSTAKPKVQLDYDVAQNRLKIAHEEFQKAKAALIKEGCEHSESYRSTWSWSRSNGYGRWTTTKIPLCKICGQVDTWSTGNWEPIPVNNYDD
jgi:hypothetical protein